jgi:hypothetical protein
MEDGKLVQAQHVPTLDRYPNQHHFPPWTEWWSQIVYVLETGPITRRDIILAAANKDGGAHVDLKTPKSYEALPTGVWKISYDAATYDTPIPLDKVQNADIRQMAHELLSSKDLTDLAA